jgi:hypothetical protein
MLYDSWNLYRGDFDLLESTGDYTQDPDSNPLASRQCGLVDASASDADDPAAGALAFYLVTGNAYGFETVLGVTGDGTVRPHGVSCGLVSN